MSLRFLLVPVSLALVLGVAGPVLAAPTNSPAPRSCLRPDTAPPGKSLVTVRVIECPAAKQISENEVKPAAPNALRTAID